MSSSPGEGVVSTQPPLRVADLPGVMIDSGEARPLGYVGPTPLVEPISPGPRYLSTALPAPCRKCGGPSWLSDDSGAIHPCCELMWTQETGCLSCRASEMLNREQRRRHGHPSTPLRH